MKNSSLHMLKPILAFLLGWIFVLSCSQEETNPDLPVGVPGPNASEAVVKLLIKGEAILPPSTRNMSDQTEGSYQDELQLLILEKQADDNTYIYNCHRPVEGTQGNFTVKVPNSLDGKELKFLLFSNSKDIIGDPDQKFVVTDGTNKNEDDIRTALLLTVNTKWDPSKKIPMWAEDSFTFSAPTPGAPSASVATLKLMRMLARVDVGLNYNGKELHSTSQELTNFKLQKIKVYHSKDKGQLMPNMAAYETTGTGTDKVITIKRPSIPMDGETITPYEITVPAGSHASERDVYLFEQDMNLSQADFDANRTCILVQGEYTAPAAGGTGTTYTGWYRLDFRDFGSDKGYADILRNKLYRFNITSVKGSGFSTEDDALNSVSSNMTVELLPLDLNQNDIIFDGQSFLSVSDSELYFYKNLNTANFSLNTNYGKGWEIETGDGSGITATPASGAAGSSVVNLAWNTLPSASVEKEIYLKAGNLKKKLMLKYVHENAPGNLTSFSLDPPLLYFAKSGGVGKINIISNITKKYLFPSLGKLDFTVPSVIETTSFDVTVQPFNQTSSEHMEQGVVNVHIQAANAEVTGQSRINQLTYDKRVECTPGPMGHGLEDKNTPALMDVTYRTSEEAGTYLINFVPTDGGVALGPVISNPVNGIGTVKVSASQNKGSKEREVGKLVFSPALNGEKISLIGYTPKEVPVIQAPAPVPVASIRPTGNITDLAWDQSNHSFTVEVDNPNFVETNEVSITTLPKNKMIDMTVPASGTLGQPVTFTLNPNRGDVPKSRTVKVSVDGHGDHVGEEQVTFTQQAPDMPVKELVLAATPSNTLPWDATEATLNLTNLDQIFEVQAGKESVNASEPLNVTLPAGGFNLTADKSSASMKVTFPKNDMEEERKVKVIATAIGNRESVKKIKEIILTQAKKLFGKIFFPEPTTVEVPWTENSFGTVPLTMESIDFNHKVIFTMEPAGARNWISAVVNGNNMAYYITENSGLARSVKVTASATDRWGNDVRTPTPLTMTQKGGPGSLEIITRDLILDYDNTERNLSLNIKRIQSSTAKITYPSWIQSARLLGDKIILAPKANTGDSGERVGDVRVEAKGNDEVPVKSNTVQVKQKANVISVDNGNMKITGKVQPGSTSSGRLSVRSDSRRFQSVRILTPIIPTDHIRPRLETISGDQKNINVKVTTEGNMKTYDKRERQVELEWTSPEGRTTKSLYNIVLAGHPGGIFEVKGGNLPRNNVPQTHVNGDTFYEARITTDNLALGTAFYLDIEEHPNNNVKFKAELLDDRGNIVTNYLVNQTVNLRLKITVLGPFEPNKGIKAFFDFVARGVDGARYVMYRINFAGPV